MEYQELIEVLQTQKQEGEILDYLIESSFMVKPPQLFVNVKLTIFGNTGKPSIMTALMQGVIPHVMLDTLQEKALVKAYMQNPTTTKNGGEYVEAFNDMFV